MTSCLFKFDLTENEYSYRWLSSKPYRKEDLFLPVVEEGFEDLPLRLLAFVLGVPFSCYRFSCYISRCIGSTTIWTLHVRMPWRTPHFEDTITLSTADLNHQKTPRLPTKILLSTKAMLVCLQVTSQMIIAFDIFFADFADLNRITSLFERRRANKTPQYELADPAH